MNVGFRSLSFKWLVSGIGDRNKINALIRCMSTKSIEEAVNIRDDKPFEIYRCTSKRIVKNQTEFSEICGNLNFTRTGHLGNITGHKSYYLFGSLAELESSLIRYALRIIKAQGFHLISVPDILCPLTIKNCGMPIDGERAQVYILDNKLALSGTSEMALAGFFSNKLIDDRHLPIKVAAVSRCFRAETSGLKSERGIYRVHQFTKVEMFAVCTKEFSERMLATFKDIEIKIFQDLGINFRVLDMPPSELGASAYQKYDIEAWLYGRKIWGEISSCSNCTDYQSSRLNIRCSTKDNLAKSIHTVNGTAVAIPRLLIALVETNQINDDNIMIPNKLAKFLKKSKITMEKYIPPTKLLKRFTNKKLM